MVCEFQGLCGYSGYYNECIESGDGCAKEYKTANRDFLENIGWSDLDDDSKDVLKLELRVN